MDRPEASQLAAGLLAVLAVTALVTAAGESIWFSVHGEGIYTEGISRQPRFNVDYVVDAEQEQIDIQITNATPLLIYWQQRGDAPGAPSTSSGEVRDFDLDSARDMMQKFLLAMIIVQSLAIVFPRLRRGSVQAIWLLGLAGFLVVVPMGIAASFGFDEPAGGFSDETDSREFAHFESDASYHLGLDGLDVEFTTSGFDLGLVPYENQSEIRAQAPLPGEPFADTYIEFEGVLTMKYADALMQWLAIPLVWVAVWLAARPGSSKVVEEE